MLRGRKVVDLCYSKNDKAYKISLNILKDQLGAVLRCDTMDFRFKGKKIMQVLITGHDGTGL
jgi:hypothetical protein